MSPDLAGSSLFRKSPYVELRLTNHGGRSLFATCDIEPGTRIHSSEAPFAYVIYKDYRKEVCAQCFAYSAGDHAPPTVGTSRTWNIKWCREGGMTVWFCSDVCKDGWECDTISPLLMEVNALLIKAQAATRKRSKSMEDEVKARAMFPAFESTDRAFTQAIIDGAWEGVEALVASRAQLALCCSTLRLEGMELEIARSIAAAVVHRYCDEQSFASNPASAAQNQSESWAQLLNLQTNELRDIQTRPYMLTTYLRVYVFLSNALPKYLRGFMSTVREMLVREPGNAFGIWDGDRRDEMMGWGIWVSASYFNHCCTPNVVKTREGRTLHFEVTRKVQAGEELCISYIDTDSPANQRRRELETSWFFTCRCPSCEREI